MPWMGTFIRNLKKHNIIIKRLFPNFPVSLVLTFRIQIFEISMPHNFGIGLDLFRQAHISKRDSTGHGRELRFEGSCLVTPGRISPSDKQ
jgi:hypothetical protein